MTTSGRGYWFPAKRYGWGWGLPLAWQGWAVLAVYEVLLLAGVVLFRTGRALPAFLVYVAALSAVLIAITRLKGEPPRWRWGEKDR